MKILLAALSILASAPAFAWSPISSCNNGELVVDQGDNDFAGRPTFQLVVRGQALQKLVSQDAADVAQINSKGELIVSVNTYNSQLKGFTPFKTLADGMQSYRNYYVERQGSSVTLRATIGNGFVGEIGKAKLDFQGCN